MVVRVLRNQYYSHDSAIDLQIKQSINWPVTWTFSLPSPLRIAAWTKATIRKLINTNRNTEGIFSSVNFRGILPTEIFPPYILRELPWEKKLKQSKKKWWRVIFTNRIPSVNLLVKIWTLFIMSITKGITDEIVRRYFTESSRTVHFPIALLIVVLYGQNHRRIEKSSVLFGGFLKKFN